MRIYVSSAETGLTSKQRASIAKKSTDPKELSRLAYDNAASVRLAVLENEHTPQKVVEQLAREFVDDRNWDTRLIVARKTSDSNLLAKLADDEDWSVREAVAEKTDDPNLLAKLADDASWDVRKAVVIRTTDPNLLAKLADDTNWAVRKAVVRKTNDPNLLAKLAYDESWIVRKEFAKKTDDLNLLAKLADDESWDVREVVASRTNDPNLIAKLADDESWIVRVTVVNKTEDSSLLAKLADDESWIVREAVAKKIDDPNILAKLADDENQRVREAARMERQAASSRNSKSRKQPQSDWSIPLYSINNYSEIEGEITKVISDAANEFARKYMGESAQVEVAPGAYDDSTGVVKIHVGENTYTVDAEDILPPATSKQKKRDCVKSLVAWMQANLPAATDETMTTM